MQRKGCAFACHKGICRSKCGGYTRSSPRQQMQVMVSFTPPSLLLEYAQNRKLGWLQGWGGSFENGCVPMTGKQTRLLGRSTRSL